MQEQAALVERDGEISDLRRPMTEDSELSAGKESRVAPEAKPERGEPGEPGAGDREEGSGARSPVQGRPLRVSRGIRMSWPDRGG